MSNLKFGIHSDGSYEGGQYNILASFAVGLQDALAKNNIDSEYMYKRAEQNIAPNVSIAFNGSGGPSWQQLLDLGITHIMWNVDSVFYQNFEGIKQYSDKYENFALFNVSQADDKAINHFLPKLKYFYMPHGVDPKVWDVGEKEKEHEIVLTSHLTDYEAKLRELKQTLNRNSYNFFMELYELVMSNSKDSFWEIYEKFALEKGIDLDDMYLYRDCFMNICYLTTHAKRVRLVKKLKDFPVKVWGAPLWEKYTEGNVQYMGLANLFDTVDITSKSKIALHLQPLQVFYGLHERVLNASLAGALIVSDEAPYIQDSYKDSLVYYNNNTFAELEENIEYYLTNDFARVEKVQKAKQITLENHTWEHRAKRLMKLFNC